MDTVGSRCLLCTLDYNPIPADVGSLVYPLVLIIGRDPGADEDSLGKVFCEKCGRLLRSDLDLVGYRKKDFIITNLVKCHTPNNRGPTPYEIDCCSNVIQKEIAHWKPKIILTLGTDASAFILGNSIAIKKDRGFYETRHKYNVVATYHPSFISQYGRKYRPIFQDDLKLALTKAQEMNHQYVYIMHCERNDSYYVGMTNNIERRMEEHKKGTGSRYTRAMKPCKILYYETFYTRSDASLRENELKRFSKQDKITLIETHKEVMKNVL